MTAKLRPMNSRNSSFLSVASAPAKDVQVNEVVVEDTDIRFLYHVLYTGVIISPVYIHTYRGVLPKGHRIFAMKFEREFAGDVESLRSRADPYLTHLAQWLLGLVWERTKKSLSLSLNLDSHF